MMLKVKQFVPGQICLSCDGCCRYSDKTTVWAPLFLFEEILELTGKNIVPCCLFTHPGRITKKAARINLTEEQGMYICPCFNLPDHTCKIYPFRPLDCQLYPFLLARKKNKLFLALDEKCPYARRVMDSLVFDSYVKYLLEFLSTNDFLQATVSNPEIFQDYDSDIKYLADLPHFTQRVYGTSPSQP